MPLSSSAVPTPGYRRSSYQFIRFGADAAQKRSVHTSRGVIYQGWNSAMSEGELRLLKAEALIRLGRSAEAVPLINTSRTATAKGGLPAVGINGPTQPYPQCVPKSFVNPGVCGNLMDAMLYEKRMESLGTDPFVNWVDWRAFGYLEPGSVVYFPPSFRDTDFMGFPYYTYGGVLPGSANSPTPCPTGTWQSIGCVNYTSVRQIPPP
jgi:hypothetical protein